MGKYGARGCLIEGGRWLLMRNSRCAGLIDRGREEAASGTASWGCSIEGEMRMLLAELPLRGAA